jgi:hypothetical protein
VHLKDVAFGDPTGLWHLRVDRNAGDPRLDHLGKEPLVHASSQWHKYHGRRSESEV